VDRWSSREGLYQGLLVLSKYLKAFEIGIQNTFVYRWNFFLRSLFGIFPLLGTIFIWRAIFEARGSGISDFDFATMVFYFLLVLFLDNLIAPTDDEWQVATDIRDGQMNGFIVKPINYLFYRFSLFVSNRLLYTAVTLPVVIGIFFMFRRYLQWPADWEIWALALLSVGLAGLLQFLIAFSVALLAFWMLEISTVVFILYSFEFFLSGHMFPLGLVSPPIREVLNWTPFPYELYFPISIFMAKASGVTLWKGLAIQASWVMIMWIVAARLWRRGLRRYQAVGG